jgi:hypothetical protein
MEINGLYISGESNDGKNIDEIGKNFLIPFIQSNVIFNNLVIQNITLERARFI